jgi:hypothetical protein
MNPDAFRNLVLVPGDQLNAAAALDEGDENGTF